MLFRSSLRGGGKRRRVESQRRILRSVPPLLRRGRRERRRKVGEGERRRGVEGRREEGRKRLDRRRRREVVLRHRGGVGAEAAAEEGVSRLESRRRRRGRSTVGAEMLYDVLALLMSASFCCRSAPLLSLVLAIRGSVWRHCSWISLLLRSRGSSLELGRARRCWIGVPGEMHGERLQRSA